MSGLQVLMLIRKGAIRDGLVALFSAIPELKLACLSNNSLDNAEYWLDYHPDLFLLDTAFLGEDTLRWHEHLKMHFPEAGCVALVEDLHQAPALQQAGIGKTILLGTRADDLFAYLFQTIENLRENSLESCSEPEH